MLFFLPWQENEKVETEIEYLLQNFDSEMGKKQVQTQAPQSVQSVYSFSVDSNSCAC